jgi:hypothetical protein
MTLGMIMRQILGERITKRSLTQYQHRIWHAYIKARYTDRLTNFLSTILTISTRWWL